MRRRGGAALALLLALPAGATDLALPFPATETFARTRPFDSHRIATARFDDGPPQVTAEGAVTRRTWQLDGATSTLAILAPLRDQLLADGWQAVFECDTETCGGFDFRFEIDVTPAPAMFVDLADFRYLVAQRDAAWTTLLASRSGALGYLQLTTVEPAAAPVPAPGPDAGDAPAGPVVAAAPTDGEGDGGGDGVAAALARTGHAVLADLDFATGSADLPGEDYASLDALAQVLADRPGLRIALVGHTDAVGGAEGNMAISRRRAESARRLLVGRYDVDPGRIEVHGVGYFAPITANDTDAGRRTNRRVEAVIVSTE